MPNDYLTTPWQNSENQSVLQQLRRMGYNVEQNNGKTTIKIGDKTYEVDLSKPIWTTMAEIGNIEAENKREEIKKDNQKRADGYHDSYMQKMYEIEATKKIRNKSLELWNGARTALRRILGKNKADTIAEIRDNKDKQQAEQFSADATTNKFNWIWAGNDILSMCNDALGDALEEGKWSTMALLG